MESELEPPRRSSSIKPPSSFLADSLPNMNPYQHETAENTPEIATVWINENDFCIFLLKFREFSSPFSPQGLKDLSGRESLDGPRPIF